MTLLYKFAVQIYNLIIWFAAPFNGKARLYVSGRRKWLLKLKRQIDSGSRYIWVHCASLGEFEQGRPVIEAIRQQYPEYKIILTFFSPSGYEIRKKYPFADIVSYLPPDTRRNARLFINTVKPVKAMFVKYEFWYHYITELQRRSVPLYLISGIFRKNQVFFSKMPWGKWFRSMLPGFTHFFVQDETSVKLLNSIGIEKCTISGDTRFDRVADIAKSAKDIPIVDKFIGNKPCIVAGSTWKPDEELLAGFINHNQHVKWIIAPHEVTPENVRKLEKLLKKQTVRLSLADPMEVHHYDVIIVDSIGLLSSLYRYGKIAYIGGGFGKGIHNILEAATFGLPVVFGPHFKKFREACDLVDRGAAFPVHNQLDLEEALTKLLSDSSFLDEASGISKAYVKNNRGATNIIVNQIFQ